MPNNSQKVYLIDNEEYICIKDDDYNYTILTDGREQGIKWPFRILRELLVREREDTGNLFMHGTGILLNESGILLLGNSGSGKTTLAVEMISVDIEKRDLFQMIEFLGEMEKCNIFLYQLYLKVEQQKIIDI